MIVCDIWCKKSLDDARRHGINNHPKIYLGLSWQTTVNTMKLDAVHSIYLLSTVIILIVDLKTRKVRYVTKEKKRCQHYSELLRGFCNNWKIYILGLITSVLRGAQPEELIKWPIGKYNNNYCWPGWWSGPTHPNVQQFRSDRYSCSGVLGNLHNDSRHPKLHFITL